MSELTERLRTDVVRSYGTQSALNYAAADEIERLEKEVERLRDDAKRYQWLKENHLQLAPDCWIRTGDDLDDATAEALDEPR